MIKIFKIGSNLPLLLNLLLVAVFLPAMKPKHHLMLLVLQKLRPQLLLQTTKPPKTMLKVTPVENNLMQTFEHENNAIM